MRSVKAMMIFFYVGFKSFLKPDLSRSEQWVSSYEQLKRIVNMRVYYYILK